MRLHDKILLSYYKLIYKCYYNNFIVYMYFVFFLIVIGFYFKNHPPIIVFLGRIDPLKDIETLIRAAALVHQTAPEARFVLYGKAPRGNEWYYEKCLNLRRELGVEDSVEFAGFAETAESVSRDS